MAKRGKIISIEGSDGAGKATQTKRLLERAKSSGIKIFSFSFPDYTTTTGKMIRAYLNGEFGDPAKLPPKQSAAPYAWNREEKASLIGYHLISGTNILCDRYIGSNWIHQAAKLPPEEREDFVKWNIDFEKRLGVAMPDRTYGLWVPRTESVKAMDREERKQDGHESNEDYQERVMETFSWLCKSKNDWLLIDCVNHETGKRLSKTEVTDKIWQDLESFLTK